MPTPTNMFKNRALGYTGGSRVEVKIRKVDECMNWAATHCQHTWNVLKLHSMTSNVTMFFADESDMVMFKLSMPPECFYHKSD